MVANTTLKSSKDQSMCARVVTVDYALPETCVSNEDLDRARPEWDIASVAKRTGVEQRFVCRPDETALDLSVLACDRLFACAPIPTEDLDTLLVCTQSPDHVMPPNSALLQHRLHLPKTIAAFDYTLACSGYVYGLWLANALIRSGQSRALLLVTAETYSKHIHPGDRSTSALFGDAAAATLLVAGDAGLGPFVLGTDGSGGGRFVVPAGGARLPKSAETARERRDDRGNVRSQEHIHMDGLDVLNFVKREIPKAIREVLIKAGTTMAEIDLVVCHQASSLALDFLQTALEIPRSKMFINLDRVGNTVSASIPVALRDAEEAGLLRPGHRVLLCGFGVGYSWGACIMQW